MTALYNRYGKPPEAVEFLDSGAVDAALNSGNWVLTQGEVTGGTPPAPPALPTEGSPGVPVGDQFTIAGLDASTDPVEDVDWLPILYAGTGYERRVTRETLMNGVSLPWSAITGKPDYYPVDWGDIPSAISSTVSSTGGAGPSDTMPLQQWKSADGLYGFGFRWRTDGRVDLFHKWNGVEYTPISMPPRANLGGGASTAEFILGGPQITGTPLQRGLLSIAWGTYTRFARLLNPDGFDAAALRLIFAAPSGETANLRQLQTANSYHGWFASNTYGASSVPTFAIQHGANAVNGLQVTSGDAGTPAKLEAKGSDTNLDAVVKPKGTGAFSVEVATGQAAKFYASGPDANHRAEFYAKGAGTAVLGETANLLAFFGGTGAAKATFTGSRSTDTVAILTDLLQYLEDLNLIVDNTTA
jgi:hypothetical protein